MNINEFLKTAAARLEAAGIATARLDCLVLMEDVLNTNRTQLLAHPEQEITELELAILEDFINKRARHIPLAYLRGKTEFYGREFIINEDVLEPRPESETMMDLIKQLAKGQSYHIIDIGTGSGALAVTAKLELPEAKVIATDIDKNCLKVARQNGKALKADVEFHQGNLLAALPPSTFHLPPSKVAILANLPYVPDNFQINTAALHEPRRAIFGGPDGLDLYRQLFKQASSLNHPPDYILTESMPPQHAQLKQIASDNHYEEVMNDDFIQTFVAKS